MPIYEFYCSACHALFSFFSARVDTEKRPACPRCAAPGLERKPATFATLSHAGGAQDGPDEGAPDEALLDRAMAELAGEMEAAGESDDPRHMARMMRRFGEVSGLEMGSEMESMISRLEAGESADKIEEEMEALGDDGESSPDELFQLRKKAAARRARRPEIDDELYFF